jgi:hypothetical protein
MTSIIRTRRIRNLKYKEWKKTVIAAKKQSIKSSLAVENKY